LLQDLGRSERSERLSLLKIKDLLKLPDRGSRRRRLLHVVTKRDFALPLRRRIFATVQSGLLESAV
jgi:hypothetical protein